MDLARRVRLREQPNQSSPRERREMDLVRLMRLQEQPNQSSPRERCEMDPANGERPGGRESTSVFPETPLRRVRLPPPQTRHMSLVTRHWLCPTAEILRLTPSAFLRIVPAFWNATIRSRASRQ